MDEATLSRIVTIVKNMQVSGMAEDEVIDNLRQMGLADEDLTKIMQRCGLAAPAKPAPPVEEPELVLPEEHFERLHSNVAELHAKHDDLRADLGALDDIKKSLVELKAEVDEIRPMLAAMKRMNENLVEINKKMLARFGTTD